MTTEAPSLPAPTLMLRYMRVADIAQVTAIDNLSFDTPWSARSYTFEVTESNYSHMVVLEHSAPPKPLPRWRRWMQSGKTTPLQSEIVSYGGLWHIMDEAHISTIASHPQHRGQGYGEIALAGMIRKALLLRTSFIVLEVRVSNKTAQNLYLKYGFKTVNVKQRYYHNNGEDAYEMQINFDQDPSYSARFAPRYAELMARHGFIDEYTESAPIRGGQA